MKVFRLMVLAGLIPFLHFYEAGAQSPAPPAVSRAQPGGVSAGDSMGYIDGLNRTARSWYGVNVDSSFYYSKKALAISERCGYGRGQAESWRLIGNAYEMVGDYQLMLHSYHRSRMIAGQIGDHGLVSKANVNIGLFYNEVGEYEEALRQVGIGDTLVASNGDSTEQAYILSYLSEVAVERGKGAEALDYARRSVQMGRLIQDSLAITGFNDNLGRALAATGSYRESFLLHQQSLGFYLRTCDKLGQAASYNDMARSSFLLKNYGDALRYANQAMELATGLRRVKEMRDASGLLGAIYESRGDYPMALHYAKFYKQYSDSLFTEMTRRQVLLHEAKDEFDRKEDSMKVAQDKRDALQHHIDRNHTLQTMVDVLLIVFLTGVAFILWRQQAISKKNHRILFEKNKEIELQKEAMEHQAVQLLLNNQEKDKLFSIIAHDLKGPLNSLKGLLDFLKENKLPENEIKSMIAELQRNVDYSSELVGNLLFWASSQLDGISASPVKLSMHQLVTDVLGLFVKQASDKNITIKNEIPANVCAFADRDMVQVIFRNLLNNAIKFCRSGDVITISGHTAKGVVEICVADTGIGMSPEILEKIRRKESVTSYGTAKEKGTGLGMLLCREFAEANRGNLRIESALAAGSQFYFTMPADESSSSINV